MRESREQRARGAEIGARVVLCLHDELLVHVPAEHADAAATLDTRQPLQPLAQPPGVLLRLTGGTWSEVNLTPALRHVAARLARRATRDRFLVGRDDGCQPAPPRLGRQSLTKRFSPHISRIVLQKGKGIC